MNRPKGNDRPTPEEKKKWTEEADLFQYNAPNQNAPSSTPEFLGWGVPPDRMPPPDAVSYVLCKYREDELGIRNHDPRRADYEPIHPMYKWSFLLACIGHFMWFRTAAGAKWIMKLYGIEETQAFHEGYAYFLVDDRGEGHYLAPPVYQSDERIPHKKNLVSGVELRIFRQWERDLEPPCSAQNTAPFEEIKKLLTRVRSPYATQEIAFPADAIFFWVAEVLRDWFIERQPNKDWPTRKVDRICGWQWVANLERSPGVKFFEPLEQIKLHGARAYRIQNERGGVHWVGGKQMRIVPLTDIHRSQGTMDEAKIAEMYLCKSCRHVKTCVPFTGGNHRCCHCYALEHEQGDRPTLAKCTMDRECKACPDVITSHSDLVNIKNRWNRPARTSPVPRG